VAARDSVSVLKFNGALELTGTTATELDKDQFVRAVQKGVREHGQQFLYAMVVYLLAHHNLFSVDEVLANIAAVEVAVDVSKYDAYEEGEFGLSRLLAERKLGEPLREKNPRPV
jgi:hypothetical protein